MLAAGCACCAHDEMERLFGTVPASARNAGSRLGHLHFASDAEGSF